MTVFSLRTAIILYILIKFSYFGNMKYKAIIIDDEAKARRLLQVLLEENCPDVEIVAQAEDVPAAVKAIHQHKPDIVLLDINMSKINGLAAYRQILQENPRTVCILVSAEHHPETFEAAKELGIQNFLIKPFTEHELDFEIREVIGRLDIGTTSRESEDERLRRLAEEYVRVQRTDEEAVRVLEQAVQLPNSELRWMQTLAMVYVVRQRWGKLKAIAEQLEHRTK